MTESNLQSSLLAFQAMADFGHQLSATHAFPEKVRHMLRSLVSSVGSRCAAIYGLFGEMELHLVASLDSESARYPKTISFAESQLQALRSLFRPQVLNDSARHRLLATSSAVSADLFGMIAALPAGSNLSGLLILGAPAESGGYGETQIEAVNLLSGSIALVLQNQQLAEKLEAQVRDNLRLVTSLNELQDQALQAFALAIDAKDASRRGHSPRVAAYSVAIGRALGMDGRGLAGIRAAGYLHDIGDMNIDKAIFRKQSALHPDEFREIADHSMFGYQIVRHVKFPWPEIADVVRSHHERADGSGYPDRLRGDEVSLPVKIIAAADTFDAMMSERPYRQPRNAKSAMQELVRLTPEKFDASVIQSLLVQLRRETEGKSEVRLLPPDAQMPSAREYDMLSVELLKKVTNYRVYSA